MANEGGDKELREAKKSYRGVAARECDSCRVSPALIYCRVDSVFLCGVCDSRVHHSASPLLRHERVWMCEVCEQAPAAFTCKADAAALCPSCDTDIHSANPLARRHERVPIAPFFDSPGVAKHAAGAGAPVLKPSDEEEEEDDGDRNDREAEVASWLLPNPKGAAIGGMEAAPPVKAGAGGGGEQLFYFSEVDPYLDLDFGSSMDNARFHHQMDSVVPVQNKAPAAAAAFYPPPPYFAPPAGAGSYEIDFTRSKVSCSYSPPLSHSVSSSEVGLVPDGNATPDVSTAYGTPVPTIPASPVGQPMPAATPAVGQDREARVMRYREKRKNRKFEKTIRYASRKAYAETRPRIKGRFAKRTDNEENADSAVTSFFSPPSSAYPTSGFLAADAGYGVVPSF